MPDLTRRGTGGATAVAPQVGPAHAGRDHPDDRVVTGRQLRVRQRFQPHVPRPIHHRCTHVTRTLLSRYWPTLPIGAARPGRADRRGETIGHHPVDDGCRLLLISADGGGGGSNGAWTRLFRPNSPAWPLAPG